MYLTDTLQTAASQAVAEGADYTALSLSTPSRLTNLVQHVAVPFKVTRTQQAVEHYHQKNELERQTEKALMDWGNAAEFDLVRSTLVSGASGTVPKMSGIIEATSKSTNHTSHNSGTAWNSTISILWPLLATIGGELRKLQGTLTEAICSETRKGTFNDYNRRLPLGAWNSLNCMATCRGMQK